MFKIQKRDNIGLRGVKGKFTMKVPFEKKSYFLCMLHESAHRKTWISLSLRVVYVAHCSKSKSVSYMLDICLYQSIRDDSNKISDFEFFIDFKKLFHFINIFL